MAASAWPEQWPGLVELGPMRPRLSLTAAWRHGRDVCVPTTMRIRMSRGLIMHLDRTAVAVWSVNGSLLAQLFQHNFDKNIVNSNRVVLNRDPEVFQHVIKYLENSKSQ